MIKIKNSIVSLIVLAFVFGGTVSTNASVGFTGPYEMQNWSSSGISAGTTTISPTSGPTTSAEFSYDVSGLAWVSYRTATFSATAAGTGYVMFDWTSHIFHAWFDVYADFYVFANGSSGTTSIHEVDFYNLMYTGPRTFSGSSTIWVEEGYDFGFIVGGSNYDSAGFINGTLTVSNFVAPPVILAIDIKPGSCPNPFIAKSRGSVPVAIVGSADFDVTQVDLNSLQLQGVSIVPDNVLIEDVTEPYESDPNAYYCQDCFDADDNYNCDLWDQTVSPPVSGQDGVLDSYCGDGFLDLIVKFDTQELVEAIGSANSSDCVKLTLTGNLLDGTSIEGYDIILIRKDQ